MIVIVQSDRGEEIFRFDQDRADTGAPTIERIAEALEQAREPLPKTTDAQTA